MMGGSLVIVGSGIKAVSHLTLEAITYIKAADKVFHVLTDEVAEDYVASLNPSAESLKRFYVEGQDRLSTYRNMKELILQTVHSGKAVCAVFYGHPGVFVTPSHEAIGEAHRAGLPAFMLPGISAEDCLFADLGFDPAERGCQSYEATHFLIFKKRFDPSSALILWQVGSIADPCFTPTKKNVTGLTHLKNYLLPHYESTHQVYLYEAAIFPLGRPNIQRIELSRLDERALSGITTLYVPPRPETIDLQMLATLGLRQRDESSGHWATDNARVSDEALAPG